jgi:hypothetical protein
MDDQGYIRSQIDSNKCVVPANPSANSASLAAGTDLFIYDCLNDFESMQFVRFTDSSIRPRNDSDQCIDVTGASVASQGAPLQLFDCNGNADKVWSRVF